MQIVFDIAARRAELTPDKIAFTEVETGKQLSYAELNARACRFASWLQGQGIGSGDRVAILCLNTTSFFEILFACGKLGAILVPLNWRQPAPELLPVVQDAAAKLLIHDAENAAVADALNLPLLSLAGYEQAVAASTSDNFDTAWPADRIWYMLYTSGTTGKPKAVIQTPGMAYANAINIGQAIDLTSADTTLNYLPLFHTAGINLHTLPVLIFGGSVQVLKKFEIDPVMAALQNGDCTAFLGVPAIYQAISLHKDFATADFSKVRSWSCGGAPLPITLIELFARRDVLVCNGMGMTETGPTVFLMDRAHAKAKIGSVGKPQILAEVRVVDDHDAPLPHDHAGELQIRGPGVTPGYWNNESATKSAFTRDGWLRTGDVARRDANGYYYIVDRIKDMFISGGENVYPAEVEIVIYRFPGVLECAVIGVPDEKWGEVGCAYVLPQPGGSVDGEALRVYCRENLAAYKVPKHIRIIEDFPRTAAGKVQKHILRSRFSETPS
ncbi:long-chain fatty acid--CoA ligase [Ferrovibrio terrae]|uniref:3-methylmercaptopropionyl-CoA ligase n=1 Tax=Ferrovibrio terrae TaxID=2594003 RepID=A0A516H5I9_9PROT|nr:long-chain fatty acid--CoA ligase [Ferrovibrio terrae]QDO99064.1 long-chain fatty acid--CoA ligase [Ferrovibrio terrae]